jgi:hypothetical protein
MSEFSRGGRTGFFSNNPWTFWVKGSRSGLLPEPLIPPLLLAGLLLPLVEAGRRRLPLASHLLPGLRPFLQVLLASLGAFVLAHLTLFRLYFPSRYTETTVSVLLALASGVVAAVALEAVHRQATRPGRGRAWRTWAARFSAAGLVALLLVFPWLPTGSGGDFPVTRYSIGREPALYAFFASQPKDVLIASLADVADDLPTFARRSVLVGEEYALPLHPAYYHQVQRRATELIEAQYADDPATLSGVLERYGIDFWIVHRAAFTPGHLERNRWIGRFPAAAAEARAALQRGRVPLLARLIPRCEALRVSSYVVLDADCLARDSARLADGLSSPTRPEPAGG